MLIVIFVVNRHGYGLDAVMIRRVIHRSWLVLSFVSAPTKPKTFQSCIFQQVRELFKQNVFLSKDPMNRMTLIDATLPKAVQADAVLRTLRREKREATADEQALIDEVEAAREIIIQVCVYVRVSVCGFCVRAFMCVITGLCPITHVHVSDYYCKSTTRRYY